MCHWLAREMAAKGADSDGHGFDTSIDPSEREFGPSGISLSPYRFPTGWFIVGFASDLSPGEVKRVHYFGEEMVLFRTESGQVTCWTPTVSTLAPTWVSAARSRGRTSSAPGTGGGGAVTAPMR